MIELQALTPDAERVLLERLALLPDTKERLIETAGGNPFFLGVRLVALSGGRVSVPRESILRIRIRTSLPR